MNKTRAALVGTSFALFLGAVGTIGYFKNKQSGIEKQREARIAQVVSQFKACPDRFRAAKTCLSAEERIDTLGKAREDKKNGNFEEAGIAFAEILEENEAREMAGECQKRGNTDGRERIISVLSERQEAARRAESELSQ